MGRKAGKSKTVAGLLTSLGLAVPVAALPACDTHEGIESDVGMGTENPPPFDGGRFDTMPITNPPPDVPMIRDGGPIGTENPPPPDFGVEEDAPVDEDASTGDAGEDAAD